MAVGAIATVIAVALASPARHWSDSIPRSAQNSQAVGSLDEENVRRIVEEHRMEVKRACWGRQAATSKSAATVQAQLVVDAASGRVVRVTTEGTNPSVNACVEQQASAWVFPRSREGATVNVPFMFVRN